MRPPITDSTRVVARAVVLAVAFGPAVLGLAGCGTKNNTANPATTSSTTSSTAQSSTAQSSTATSSPSESTTAQVQIGNTLNYGSMGTTANIDCADGKSLNVGGSNNTLTVTGTCSTVSIGGADNKITFDKIDKRINVIGLNNTITYKDGDPKVENLGQSNTITKG